MANFASTVAAVATKLFMTDQVAHLWQRETPFLNIMSTEDLNAGRKANFEQLTPVRNTVGVAEAWKWPVEVSRPTLTESGAGQKAAYARGGTFNFAVSDNMTSASVKPYLYAYPIQVPVSDINIHASASGNEVAIAYLVNKMNSAKHGMAQYLSADIFDTAQDTAYNLNPLTREVNATNGVVGSGIDSATEAAWISVVHPLAGARLTISRLAKDIRDIRRSAMASADVIVCGSAVHNYLVEEAEARNLPYFDLVQTFGTDPNTGEAKLHLEVSHSTIKVEGAPVIVDPYLDAADPQTAYVLSTKDIMLVAAQKDNFEVHGWEDVRLTAGVDAQRALLTWSGFIATFNRATQMKYTNAKIA